MEKNLSLRKNLTGWERKLGRKKSFKDIPCENPVLKVQNITEVHTA